jgi:hypothetical protein
MVVENDPDFKSMLESVYSRSEIFSLVASFDCIENFAQEAMHHRANAAWFPELLVLDVMSSRDLRMDSATFVCALRTAGIHFATLLISSMDFGALLRVLRKTHSRGWVSVQKSSKLSEAEIIESSIAVCAEMRNV